MLYLFVGTDSISKNRKIEQLRREILGSSNLFDFTIFYGKELNDQDFKKELQQLPAKSSKKIIVIKQPEKLSTACKKAVVAFKNSVSRSILVILDVEIIGKKDTFFKQLSQGEGSRVFNFKGGYVNNTFDLAKAVEKKNSKEALTIYSQLMSKGEDVQRIIGGMIWHWQNYRQRMSKEYFKQSLDEFLDTDIRIKTGKVKPELALELLIVKLCSLKRD